MLEKIALVAALAGTLGLAAPLASHAAPPPKTPTETMPKPGISPMSPLKPDLKLMPTVQVLNPQPNICAADLKVSVQNQGNMTSKPCTLKVQVIDYHNNVKQVKEVAVPALAPSATQWFTVSVNVGSPVEYANAKFTVDSDNQNVESNEGNNAYTKVLFGQ